ncbi:MAG: hypothetical protein K2W80_04210 [Burkholderiales bacterium]|nr:hypothetical protein [Burkholderiales bacterium]
MSPQIDWKVPFPWLVMLIFAICTNIVVGAYYGGQVSKDLETQRSDLNDVKAAVVKLVDIQVQIAVLQTEIRALQRLQVTEEARAARGK